MSSDGTVLGVDGRGAGRIRVILADDEPGLLSALGELLGHVEDVDLVGTAADAEEAIGVAEARRPDVALVDVRMPGGGGPHAARGIARVSPSTRVIALSAYEDRANVLSMLRAGAVGYLVKGAPPDELVAGIRKVAEGGSSLSAEVLEGVVTELAAHLRRQDVEAEAEEALRAEIERFVSGDGVWIVLHPIHDLSTREAVGVEALARFGSIPARPPDRWFADAAALHLGRQLELRALRQALAVLPNVADRLYLSVNCSQGAAGSPELSDRIDGVEHRIVLEITEHEAIEDYGALAGRGGPRPARPGSAWPSTTSAQATRACATPSSWTPTS
jgi:DNA-binding NarL/FixJ family response regulator